MINSINKKCMCGFLAGFALLVFANTHSPATVSAAGNVESARSLFGLQQESDDREDENHEPDNKRKKQKKTRFANWYNWVNWMFSPGKWSPVLDYLERLYGNLFDIEHRAAAVLDHGF